MDHPDARGGAALRQARPRLLAHGRRLHAPRGRRGGGAPPVRRGGPPPRDGAVRVRPLGVRPGRGLARRAGAPPVGGVRARSPGWRSPTRPSPSGRLSRRMPSCGAGGRPPTRTLVRAGLGRCRPRRPHQGAGRTAPPPDRRGRVPRDRGRLATGLAGGMAAPRPRAPAPRRAAVVHRDVLAPRLGLRRAGAR